jgi:hypothetical protein
VLFQNVPKGEGWLLLCSLESPVVFPKTLRKLPQRFVLVKKGEYLYWECLFSGVPWTFQDVDEGDYDTQE